MTKIRVIKCSQPHSNSQIMKTQRGFTIVELMVGLTLSLIIAFATASIYLQVKQSFRVQSAQSQLADQGRYALTLFQHMVTQSGYRSVQNTAMAGTTLANAFSTTDTAFATGQTIVEKNSKLYVRFTGESDGNIIRCDDSTDAHYPALLAPTTIFAFALYFDSPTNTFHCGASSGTTITTGTDRVQLTNVVDTSFLYGADTSNPADMVPDLIGTPSVPRVAAAAIPDWTKVYSVQFCIVLRSQEDNLAPGGGHMSYLGCGASPTPTTATDFRLYRRFVTTVYLRNRLDNAS